MTVEGKLRATLLTEDPHEGNRVFTEGRLVFGAIEVAVDLSFVAVIGQDLDVLTELGLRDRARPSRCLKFSSTKR